MGGSPQATLVLTRKLLTVQFAARGDSGKAGLRSQTGLTPEAQKGLG